MILRDATLSELRTPLAFERVAPAPAPDVGRAAGIMARVEPRNEPAGEATISPVVLSDAHSMVPPRQEPELTFERVTAWLAVQDGETRLACASLLTDELAQAHEAARTEGLALGEREGRKQVEQEGQRLLDLLQRASAQAEKAFESECAQLAESCVDVIAEAFTKLAGDVLATHESVYAVVAEVLKRVREGREMVIRVNARDLAILQPRESELQAALGGRNLRLAADTRIEVGGCVVESNLGSLDGRLEVQLRALFETLKAAKQTPQETVT